MPVLLMSSLARLPEVYCTFPWNSQDPHVYDAFKLPKKASKSVLWREPTGLVQGTRRPPVVCLTRLPGAQKLRVPNKYINVGSMLQLPNR